MTALLRSQTGPHCIEVTSPSEAADRTFSPGATTSGFTRPSDVGPLADE
eukprot:CAMPEP_0177741232 /NCGR_PEP_ID=MMETSP0484_2-20121128/28002_1 /TAXON_ID=354590 /ORGANISM="Rhodomonas lens, Strain RHODO" /LENGTH=48 /DNA_ID= /DNA_START= /DNA_END= /DNA_ORIENTATION=